jgi:TRAP-type C4-dicarboxylate transport system permease large subunit
MAFSMEKIPTEMATLLTSLGINRYLLWAMLVIMYIFIGTFIDGLSILLLTLPVVYPIMMSLGFDSVWLGVALIICVEMAMITPPVGINIYAVQGIAGKENWRDIVLGALPFFFLQIVGIIIITIFPMFVTWLPNLMISKF